MTRRAPDAWETSKPGAYCTIMKARGEVTISVLENNQYLIQATGHEDEIVEDHDPAHARAHELAKTLD